LKMDADGQMNPGNLERLCRPLADNLADYVKGNRFYVLNANESMPGQRKFGSIALSFMTKVASGYWHVFDSQCGYTAIRASFLRMIDLDRIARDYFFENDMLIWLSTTGARVVDVPVSTLYGREVSDVSIGRVILTFPPRLLGGLFFRIMRSYFVLDFGAIGGLLASGLALMAFGLIFGSIKWIQGSDAGVPATTGTVMIAVLPLIVGVQLVLQAFAMEVSESPGAEETRQVVHQLTVRGSLD
jgi:dolichol-phosphate mannosyltransferase